MAEDRDKQSKIVKNIYAGLVAITCLQFVPIMSIMIVSSIILMVLFGAFYVYRSKYGKGSLVENHMTYLIRTFWIGSLYLTIATILAVIIFWYYGDHSYLFDFIEDYRDGEFGVNVAAMLAAYNQMIINYSVDNKSIMIIVSLIAIVPGVGFMVYRVAKGMVRAMKGHILKDKNSWF